MNQEKVFPHTISLLLAIIDNTTTDMLILDGRYLFVVEISHTSQNSNLHRFSTDFWAQNDHYL
jgi:hypothetical protein